MSSNMLQKILLFFLVSAALMATICTATEYYVSPNGSDDNPGTSTLPWKTLSFSADNLLPGDTLIVKDGQYVLSDFGEDMITPPTGAADGWITIVGEDGYKPRIIGNNNLYAAFELSNVNYLSLENLEISSDGTNPFRDGISSWEPASYIVLKDLYIHHLDGFGVDMRDINDLQVLNCTIEYCGFGAIGGSSGEHGGWQNVLIDRCSLSYGGHYYQGTPGPSPYDRPDGFGIEPCEGPIEISNTIAQHNRGDGLDSKAKNTYVHHCVVAHNYADGIKLWGDGSKVENCLIFDTGDGDVSGSPWSGMVIHSEQPYASFEVVNTAIVDHPERQAYPIYAQYDDRDIPIVIVMRNCIVSHGYGAVYMGPSVNFTSDHCLFYRPNVDAPVEAWDQVFTSAEIEGGAIGPGNLARDPLFVDYGSDDVDGYKSQTISPMVDAGTCINAPNDDLEYCSRPSGNGCDMGPFELQQGSENQSPAVPEVPTGPAKVEIDELAEYSTSTVDPDDDSVYYTFDWGDGTTDRTADMPSGELVYSSHTWYDPGTYFICVMATDVNNASSNWSNYKSVEVSFNRPPAKPLVPYGPTKVNCGRTYGYLTIGSDPDGDLLMYTFDWGDGTTSSSDYTYSNRWTKAYHVWDEPGIYEVNVVAVDERGAVSETSDTSKVNVIQLNHPPDRPVLIEGPATGFVQESYGFEFSLNDPDGDTMSLILDCGDGTHEKAYDVESESTVELVHMWNRARVYFIKAKAVDESGLTSPWSRVHRVVIK